LDINALFSASGPLSLDTTNLIAVIKETAPTKQCEDDNCLGVAEFMSKYFPRGKVFRDTERLFYKALGDRSLLRQGFFGSINPIKIIREGRRMSARQEEKGVEGNLAGEGLKLGGVMVFDRHGDIRYVHQEKTGELFPVEIIAQAVNESE